MWLYYTQILKNIRNLIWKQPKKRKPYDHIPSDYWPSPRLMRLEVPTGLIILVFAASFLVGWNFSFPTPSERMIWRVASVFNLGYGFVGILIVWAWIEMAPRHKNESINEHLSENTYKVREKEQKKWRTLASRFVAKLRNVSPEKDPQLEVPLRFFIPCTFLCAFYCIFRAYILVEDVIGLRSLPSSAYESVDWSRYIPHL